MNGFGFMGGGTTVIKCEKNLQFCDFSPLHFQKIYYYDFVRYSIKFSNFRSKILNQNFQFSSKKTFFHQKYDSTN